MAASYQNGGEKKNFYRLNSNQHAPAYELWLATQGLQTRQYQYRAVLLSDPRPNNINSWLSEFLFLDLDLITRHVLSFNFHSQTN